MSLFNPSITPALDADGVTISGAKWYFYVTGTLTPTSVYADFAFLTTLGTSVTADSAGRFVPIYLDPQVTYRAILKDAGGTTIADVDPASDVGISLTFTAAGTGAVARPLQDKMREVVSVADFGAVADCTAIGGGTDNYAAFCAARDALGDAGGRIFIPPGRYRISQQIVCTTGVTWYGNKVGQNPGALLGVSYPTSNPLFLYGSVLVFDTDVAGFMFHYHTDEVNQTTVSASITALGDASPFYEFPSAERAGLQDLTLFSNKTADLSKHGVESRSRINLTNVIVRRFAGDGVRIWGSTDGTHGTVPYGNCNFSRLDNVRSIFNAGSGFNTQGRDANGILFLNCDAASNGGWAFNDEGFLGNIYIGGQSGGNNTSGSYRATSAVAPHIFLGCYNETEGATPLNELTSACIILGGQLTAGSANPAAQNVMSVQGRLLEKAGWWWYNASGAQPVSNFMGINDTTMCVWSFGAAAQQSGYKLNYDNTAFTFNLSYGGSTTNTALQLPFQGVVGLRTNANGAGWGTAFPGGIYYGGDGFGGGRKQHHNTGTAAPTVGSWVQGDIIWNSAPTAGGTLGWVCTTTGVDAGAVFKAISGIAA